MCVRERKCPAMTKFRQCVTIFFGASLLILSGLPIAASTALPDSVSQDFSPLEGYILMQSNGEYLVDIDAAQGVQVGDLLSVSQPGEEIRHPISGKTVGFLNHTLAVLRITQIRPNYSYAQVISGHTDLRKGTPVKRFVGLRARLSGQGPATANLYQELRAALPSFDWQGPSNPETEGEKAADLLFTLTGTLLEVHNASGQRLHSYSLQDSTIDSNIPPSPLVSLSAASQAATPVTWQEKPSAAGSVSYESDLSGVKTLGTLKADTLMSDFISTADGLLMATTDGFTVYLYRVSDHLELVTEFPFSGRNIHALSWWLPTPNSLYLTVSGSSKSSPTTGTSTETTPRSSILKFDSGQLNPINENISYFLGTYDRDGNGTRETLLGQDLDLDIFYGRVAELHLDGDNIQVDAPGYDLPSPFPVQGSLFADLTGDGSLETVTLTRGILTVYQGRKILYQSKKELGGSISKLTYDTNPGQADALYTSATFEVAPLAADIDGDGQLELISVSSDYPSVTTAWKQSNPSGFKLSVLKFRDGNFLKGTFGKTFNHPLQGFYALKKELLLVISRLTTAPHDNIASQLVAIQLQN